MTTLSSDTTPEAEAVLLQLLRQAPVWKRLQMIDEMYDTLRLLASADLRRCHPNASDEELTRRLIARFLNREEVVAAYGWDPAAEGYSFFEKSHGHAH
ncbi:MAG: hypothetical protein DMF73_01680 [Acidobacteria bacterium]|nr:MAG: hypothetical protein DMF73_01680 [Acidobacteriota bacterium]